MFIPVMIPDKDLGDTQIKPRESFTNCDTCHISGPVLGVTDAEMNRVQGLRFLYNALWCFLEACTR